MKRFMIFLSINDYGFLFAFSFFLQSFFIYFFLQFQRTSLLTDVVILVLVMYKYLKIMYYRG